MLQSLHNLAFSAPPYASIFAFFAMALHMRIDLHQRAKIQA
jgi:hypothetical protein